MQARRRLDLAIRPAIGVAGLEVEQVDGRRPAAHPEQDARTLALRVLDGIGGEGGKPAGRGRAKAGGDAEHVATGKCGTHGVSSAFA